MSRYARQTILPEVGQSGQARLSAAKALVIGAGGLGVPALLYLAGAGIGQIDIVDPDVVEETNLHRQPIYGAGTLGQPKAAAIATHLADLNPEVRVTPHMTALTPASVDVLTTGADVVLDCADSHAVSYILSDHCRASGQALISASALAFDGYAGGFCGGAPSLRAVFPMVPNDGQTCATAGVLGPIVGMLGAMQAQMALAVLLGLEPSPLGQLVRLDGRSLRTSSFRFDGAEEPADQPQFISPTEISATDIIVDLRSTDEAPAPAHPAALRSTVEGVADTLAPRNTGARVVLCCRSGLRAMRAAQSIADTWSGPIALTAITISDQEETQ